MLFPVNRNVFDVWYDQSPLVGAGVEVINGGRGIKNPLLQNNVLTHLVNAQQLGTFASFHFLPHSAMLARYTLSLCVCLSVYRSVRHKSQYYQDAGR